MNGKSRREVIPLSLALLAGLSGCLGTGTVRGGVRLARILNAARRAIFSSDESPEQLSEPPTSSPPPNTPLPERSTPPGGYDEYDNLPDFSPELVHQEQQAVFLRHGEMFVEELGFVISGRLEVDLIQGINPNTDFIAVLTRENYKRLQLDLYAGADPRNTSLGIEPNKRGQDSYEYELEDNEYVLLLASGDSFTQTEEFDYTPEPVNVEFEYRLYD